MNHMQDNFHDNCNELMMLRWFRDNFVNKDDIKHYYDVAPIIVAKINSIPENNKIYKWIYEHVVQPCVVAIQNNDYEFAYNRYKSSVLALEEQFINCELDNNNSKTLRIK